MSKNWKAATLAVQGGYEPKDGEPRVAPIVQSTTYRYDTTQSVADLFDLKREGFFYSRLANPTVDVMEKKIAITIGRQCGSGGREIGFRLGELLGIKVYDDELITLAAEKKGIDPDYLQRIDEKATNSLLYTLAVSSSLFRNHNVHTDMSVNDRLFIGQTEVIREIAAQESAIFVGRCADYILRKNPNCINLFFYADQQWRIEHLSNLEGTSAKEATEKIAKKDKSRMNYYNFYTGKKWGKFDNYHLSFDSSLLGIEGTARAIVDIVRVYLAQEGAAQANAGVEKNS